ncbi:MAG: ribonuclease HII [Bacteroidetes bacterium]|nr:ribonuclease HII [Rhodothermia bacterium]MCS7155451.1 ribonuclease HII [Bacteroidota bacterium]MCX7907456.1 ribonuclease HII [Bacteroidota bacterium]MDW8138450.1 ribonuclease HII [Bacteroidota bacterium]MDW8284613.1 ribonuclease HII [Bacteroidota bacterium]
MEASTQLDPETHWRLRGLRRIAGVDEAGRGCLAGPVVAAAVVLPDPPAISGLKDSKACRPEERERLFAQIQQVALAIGVGIAEPAEIDRLNILRASLRAMERAIAALGLEPELVLVDGPVFRSFWIPYQTVIRGDALCPSIMAASIVAKVTRDRIMCELDRQHPQYGWRRNKGYPTAEHYAALARHGPSPWHRRRFRLERG